MSAPNPNNNNDNNNSDQDQKYKWVAIVAFTIWLFLGAAAYVYSFNCTSEIYSGGDARKVVMFILALVFGPLWWLILPFVKGEGYCKLKKKT